MYALAFVFECVYIAIRLLTMGLVRMMYDSTTRHGMFRALGPFSLLGPCRLTGILEHLSGVQPCVTLEDAHGTTTRLAFVTERLWNSMEITVLVLRVLGLLYAFHESIWYLLAWCTGLAYIFCEWASILIWPVRPHAPPSDICAFHVSRIGADGIATDVHGAAYKVTSLGGGASPSEAVTAGGMRCYVAARILYPVSTRSLAG